MTKLIRPPYKRETIVNHLKESTVALVRTDQDNDNVPYCSGVWITKYDILTAQHCIETIGKLAIKNTNIPYNAIGTTIKYVVKSDVDLSAPNHWPKFTRTGIVTAIDVAHDLALIKTSKAPISHPIVIIDHDELIDDGMPIHIVGHTVGMWWTYSIGNVSSSWTILKGPDTLLTQAIQVSGPVWSGNSGGGCYDSEGHLLGIASWINKSVPNMSFFVHHDEIVKFLNSNLNN